MKRAVCVLAVLTCLFLSAVPAVAQYGRDQHKALRGLSRVLVIFSEDDHKTDAATFTQMRDSVLSALTRSGLRVARELGVHPVRYVSGSRLRRDHGCGASRLRGWPPSTVPS